MFATRSAIISTFIISCFFSLTLITLYLTYGSNDCHEGSFLCSQSDICIANKYKCNNYSDCQHGEDEDIVMCTDFFGSMQHYDKVINTKKPDPEPKSKRNESITLCALSNYPAKCNCFNKTWLRCNNAGLTKVPRNISSNLKKISMRSNNIILSNDSFEEYYSLTVIHLQYNRLSVIPPFVFKNQNQLKFLILLHNELSILEKDALYGLVNVELLMLDNNYLVFLNLNSWKHMINVKMIDLSYNMLTFKNECFPLLPNLLMLDLQGNRIETINEFLFAYLPTLLALNLSNNAITSIHKNAFKNLSSLSELDLTYNQIKTITQEILHPLKIINKLFLGNNPITRINTVIFSEMKNLFSLDMKGINKENIELSLFNNLKTLEFLYLKEFHYCVLYAQHVKFCYPNINGLSSSYNLLPNSTFRRFLWMVTVLTLIFNSLVLYGRMFNIFKDENKAINFVIRNLAVADLFMVIYLIFIGYHDQIYRDEYYLYAHEWESSNLCTIVGIMAVISSEVSMLILVFLSLDRFLLIAVPFSGYQVLKMKTAVYCMLSIWVVGISISIAPLILWKHSSKFYGSNGLCYPLYIEDPFVNGWQYSAFMFLGLYTTSLLLMSVLYALMFINVRQTRRAARISAGDFDFAIRCFFIVLANILCWSPIIVLKLAALRKYHISSKIYVWLIIFVVPINALVNPLLYTFTTPKYITAVTSKNLFKMTYSSSERSQSSHPISMYRRKYIMKNRKKKLEEKRMEKCSTQENSLETTNDEKSSELNKIEVMQFLNNESLLNSINRQLGTSNRTIFNDDIINRFDLLLKSLRSSIRYEFKEFIIYSFGSRMTGLALKHSDVDLYIDVADNFCGKISKNLYAQNVLICYFDNLFRSRKYEYSQIRSITNTRVPIIKFFHVPSGFYCDLSFKSGLGVYNTKLINLYLSLDERIYWLVSAVVKRWALDNYMKHKSMFNSYALVWLVLFYLMVIKVVPPLILFREHADYSNSFRSNVVYIEGWDCTFCSLKKAKQIWRVPDISCWSLLLGFFKFYSDSNRFKKTVLCPAIGFAIHKDNMYDYPRINPYIFGCNQKQNGKPIDWCVELRNNFYGDGLALQDPLDLFNNLAKRITPKKLRIFSYRCNSTLELMEKKTIS